MIWFGLILCTMGLVMGLYPVNKQQSASSKHQSRLFAKIKVIPKKSYSFDAEQLGLVESDLRRNLSVEGVQPEILKAYMKDMNSSTLSTADEKILIAACARSGDIQLFQTLLTALYKAKRLSPQLLHIALHQARKYGSTPEFIQILSHALIFPIPLNVALIEEVFLQVLIPKGYINESIHLFNRIAAMEHSSEKYISINVVQALAASVTRLSDISPLATYAKLLTEHPRQIRDHMIRVLSLIVSFLRTCVVHGDVWTAIEVLSHASKNLSRPFAELYHYVFAAYHTWRDHLPKNYYYDHRAEWYRVHEFLDTWIAKSVSRNYDVSPALSTAIVQYLCAAQDTYGLLLYLHRMRHVLQHPLTSSSMIYVLEKGLLVGGSDSSSSRNSDNGHDNDSDGGFSDSDSDSDSVSTNHKAPPTLQQQQQQQQALQRLPQRFPALLATLLAAQFTHSQMFLPNSLTRLYPLILCLDSSRRLGNHNYRDSNKVDSKDNKPLMDMSISSILRRSKSLKTAVDARHYILALQEIDALFADLLAWVQGPKRLSRPSLSVLQLLTTTHSNKNDSHTSTTTTPTNNGNTSSAAVENDTNNRSNDANTGVTNNISLLADLLESSPRIQEILALFATLSSQISNSNSNNSSSAHVSKDEFDSQMGDNWAVMTQTIERVLQVAEKMTQRDSQLAAAALLSSLPAAAPLHAQHTSSSSNNNHNNYNGKDVGKQMLLLIQPPALRQLVFETLLSIVSLLTVASFPATATATAAAAPNSDSTGNLTNSGSSNSSSINNWKRQRFELLTRSFMALLYYSQYFLASSSSTTTSSSNVESNQTTSNGENNNYAKLHTVLQQLLSSTTADNHSDDDKSSEKEPNNDKSGKYSKNNSNNRNNRYNGNSSKSRFHYLAEEAFHISPPSSSSSSIMVTSSSTAATAVSSSAVTLMMNTRMAMYVDTLAKKYQLLADKILLSFAAATAAAAAAAAPSSTTHVLSTTTVTSSTTNNNNNANNADRSYHDNSVKSRQNKQKSKNTVAKQPAAVVQLLPTELEIQQDIFALLEALLRISWYNTTSNSDTHYSSDGSNKKNHNTDNTLLLQTIIQPSYQRLRALRYLWTPSDRQSVLSLTLYLALSPHLAQLMRPQRPVVVNNHHSNAVDTAADRESLLHMLIQDIKSESFLSSTPQHTGHSSSATNSSSSSSSSSTMMMWMNRYESLPLNLLLFMLLTTPSPSGTTDTRDAVIQRLLDNVNLNVNNVRSKSANVSAHKQQTTASGSSHNSSGWYVGHLRQIPSVLLLHNSSSINSNDRRDSAAATAAAASGKNTVLQDVESLLVHLTQLPQQQQQQQQMVRLLPVNRWLLKQLVQSQQESRTHSDNSKNSHNSSSRKNSVADNASTKNNNSTDDGGGAHKHDTDISAVENSMHGDSLQHIAELYGKLSSNIPNHTPHKRSSTASGTTTTTSSIASSENSWEDPSKLIMQDYLHLTATEMEFFMQLQGGYLPSHK